MPNSMPSAFSIRLDIGAAPKKKDRKSTRLNSSHSQISYAVFCLKKKKNNRQILHILSSNAATSSMHFNAHVLPDRPNAPVVDRPSGTGLETQRRDRSVDVCGVAA